jgi:hypothetical protein
VAEDTADRAKRIAASIRPRLVGQGPDVQGVVLADLVALWLAGHRPDMREEQLTLWIDAVRALVPYAEREMFGDGPRPEGWDGLD